MIIYINVLIALIGKKNYDNSFTLYTENSLSLSTSVSHKRNRMHAHAGTLCTYPSQTLHQGHRSLEVHGQSPLRFRLHVSVSPEDDEDNNNPQ